MTARNPDDTTDERSTEQPDMPTPRETQEELANVSALISSESHVEKRLEVTGRVVGGDPQVSMTLPSQVEGSFDTSSFSFSIPADRARDLAEALERRAEYADERARRINQKRDE
jgi:hypothetical protein